MKIIEDGFAFGEVSHFPELADALVEELGVGFLIVEGAFFELSF